MPGKKAQCSYCSKVMRSDNLKKHIKLHENKRCKMTHQLNVESRPALLDSSIQNHSFSDITKTASNPKVSATSFIDAIGNNGEPTIPISSRGPFTIPPAPKKVKLVKSPPKKMIPLKIDYSQMIRPAKFDYSRKIVPYSDEESDEEGPISPPKKRRFAEEE